ncbi:MAG: hypothetical protein QOJ32_3325 [Frankiaceae bacterium]|nr:hypothetical protein [Frankiaceae bacterium]
MSGFDPDAEVRVRQLNDVEWEVLHAFTYRDTSGAYNVPVGQRTDFASVPRVFIWLLPRYGRYTLSAILHDHLWRDLVAAGELTYRDADRLFRQALGSQAVPVLRRWLMWAAVRWAALRKPGGTVGWLRDAPLVLLVSLLAAPVVLPPAAVVFVALAVFYLAELVVWMSGRLVRRSSRDVPRPVLSWWT